MKPADFPIERVAVLEQGLARLAHEEHDAARQAAHDDRSTAQHGHAEAAFAYAHAASQTGRTVTQLLADLDKLAAREADPHTWPIDRLINLDEELNRERSEAIRQRHPLWGVPIEHRTQDAHLGVTASTRPGDVLLYKFVGYDVGDGDFINIDIESWRALNQLVERVAAGKPTPYDRAGNVHTGGAE